jgi:hypothetical protein
MAALGPRAAIGWFLLGFAFVLALSAMLQAHPGHFVDGWPSVADSCLSAGAYHTPGP